MRLAVLITVIALAILMIAAAVGPYFVPTATYQRMVENALSERLSARVVIDKFRLRLIPYPGYTIEGFSLISRDAPFRGMPVIEAKKVIGSLSFGALLGGDLDTDVEARDVNIHVRSEGGLTNVGMLFGLASPSPSSIPAQPAPLPSPSIRPPGGTQPAQPSVPDAPIESIPAMPAPSIDIDGQQGRQSQQGQQSLFGSLLVRNAFAASDADGRSIRLGTLEIVRGTIEVSSDKSPMPISFGGVSIAAKNLSLQGGFSAKVKVSGTMEGTSRAGMNLEGDLIVDDARREISLRNARSYFGGSQIVADIVVGYGMTPALIDIHLASPNMTQAALAPALSYFGWRMPTFISWEGTLGSDLSFKGTRDAGQLGLQFDATSARVTLGKGFSKEPGLPFKVQSEIMVRPRSFAIGEGILSLEGSDIKLSGEVVREGAMRTRLIASGVELNLAAMRSLLPWLPDLDSVDGGKVEITLEGDLFGAEGMNANGKISAKKLKLAGIEMEDLSAIFVREKDRVEFTTMRAGFADGNLSGNGRVSLGSEPSLEFDIVVTDVDAKRMPTLKDAVDGKVSMVARAASSGADRFALLKNFTVSGSFIADNAKVSGLGGAAGAFSKDTWKELSEEAGSELSKSAESELEGADEDVTDLKVAFEMKEDGVECESILWKSDLYSAEMEAEIGGSGAVDGNGTIEIDEKLSAKLVADPEARKKLFDSKGRVAIPVVASGRIAKPKMSLDPEALASLVEERLKPKPMLDLAKEEAEKEDEEVGEIKSMKAPGIDVEKEMPKTITTDAGKKKEVKKAEAKPAAKKSSSGKRSAPRKRAPAKRRSEPQMPDQPVEDILKVIIGN